MLFLSLITVKISQYYVKTNAFPNKQCSKIKPCSFKDVRELAKPGDQIFVTDRKIETRNDLIKFSEGATQLLNISVKLIGNETVINGSQLPFFWNFFLFTRAMQIGVSNFTFTHFKTPILNVNGAKNGTLANVTFIDNSLSSTYMMVLITCSQISMSGVSFIGNTVNDTSVLFLTTTQIFATDIKFEKNAAMHSASLPLLKSSNSILVFNNCTVSNNNNLDAPIGLFDGRNCIYLANSQFTKNKSPEFFVFDGITNISIDNSVIEDNSGVLVEATQIFFIHFDHSSIINNFSPVDPLFYIPDGIVSFVNNSRVSNNFGSAFIEIFDHKKVNSSVIIKNCLLEKNSFDNEVIIFNGEGSFAAINTTFNKVFSEKSVINAKDSVILMDSCEVKGIQTKFIKIDKGTLHLFNNSYIDEKEFIKGDSVVVDNDSYINIRNETSNEALKRGFIQGDDISLFNEYKSYFKPVTYDKDEDFEEIPWMDPQLLQEIEKEKNLNNDPMRYIEEYNLTEKK